MVVVNMEGRGGGEGVGDWPSGGLGALNIGNWEHIRAQRYTNNSYKQQQQMELCNLVMCSRTSSLKMTA